jgi:hypothetical protein
MHWLVIETSAAVVKIPSRTKAFQKRQNVGQTLEKILTKILGRNSAEHSGIASGLVKEVKHLG